MEEERQRAGLDPWVDHEEPLGEKTQDEIMLNYTVPVLQERPRLMWKTKMRQDKKKDEKEELIKEQRTEKKIPGEKLVVKEHLRIEGTKYYGPWVTGRKKGKTEKEKDTCCWTP